MVGAKMDHCLIVGGDSQIGSHLSLALKSKGHSVISSTRKVSTTTSNTIYLDLDQPNSWNFSLSGISTVVLCAGESRIKYCEEYPNKSRKINIDALSAISKKCILAGCHVIFLSTNLVFDGTTANVQADSPTCPKTEYGKQKLEFEGIIRSFSQSQSCILRLSKVISDKWPLLQSWLRDLNKEKTIFPFSDMYLSPITLDFTVEVIIKAIESKTEGILQISATEDISYYDFCCALMKNIGKPERLIRSATSLRQAELGDIWKPRYTSMAGDRLQQKLNLSQPSSMDSILAISKMFANNKTSNQEALTTL